MQQAPRPSRPLSDDEMSLCRELLQSGRITPEQLHAAIAATPPGGLRAALTAGHRTTTLGPAPSHRATPPLAPPRRPSDAPDGRRLGRYVLGGELGRGGMGVVHRAWDPQLDRAVAVKVLDASRTDPTQLARFEREARTAAQLRHPNIVAVHEVARAEDGTPFLVMDLVEGESLESLLRRERPTPRQVTEIVRQAALACAHAHERGIVHRDVKPENILVERATGRAYLSDFGLARKVSAERITLSGQLLGTPVYMAPEQVSADIGQVGPASDVYGLGGVLYRALAGAPPFEEAELLPLLRSVMTAEPPPLRGPEREVHPDLETIALSCLEKDPARRYADANELADELGRFLDGEPIRRRPPTRAERVRRWARRHRLAAAAIGAALLLTAGASFGGALLVAAARRRVAAERAALVERARGDADRAWAAFDAERRTDADAGEGGRRQLERLLARGLAAVQTTATWRALAPDDPAARERAREATIAYGEAALAAEQWTVAASAFEGARALGADDARTRALIARVDAERERAAVARRREVEAVLERARSGEVARLPGGYEDALFALCREPDAQTGALLIEALDEVTERLHAATREELMKAALPDADEARAGEGEIVGLGEALDRALALPPGELASAADSRPIGRAMDRLVRRDRRRRPEALAQAAPAAGAMAIVAGAQRDRLGEGPLLLARLCAEALGRVGGEGAVEALARHLFAETDGRRAISAGIALCRLGGERARQVLVAAVQRFGRNGPFARQLAPFLHRAGERTAAAGATAAEAGGSAAEELARAGELSAAGDRDGAIAALTRAVELDPGLTRAWHMRGVERGTAGDPRGAIEDFTRALELEPRMVQALSNRGAARAILGEVEAALADLDRAIELDPAQASSWAGRGHARLMAGDAKGALPDLRKAIALDPEHVAAWTNLGGALSQLGDQAGAQEALARAIELDPRLGEARVNRAATLRESGDVAAAMAEIDRVIQERPDMADAWVERAACRQALGEHRSALADLERAIEIAPGLAAAWTARGTARRALGDLDGALRDLTRATELAPSSLAAWNARGLTLSSLRDFAGAIADLSRAIELDPERAAAWNNRGNIRRESGDPAGAIADLEEALRLDPTMAEAWVNLGFAREQARRFPAAMEAYDRAIELAPRLAMAWSYRAGTKMLCGDDAGAIADFDRAIELDPRDPRALTNRGMLRCMRGDLAGGVADLDRAIELDPRQAKAFGNRGNVRRLQGDLDGALADLTRAIELDPRDPHPFGVRGIVRAQQGDAAGAIADFERYLQMAPASPNAAEVRQRLAQLRAGR